MMIFPKTVGYGEFYFGLVSNKDEYIPAPGSYIRYDKLKWDPLAEAWFNDKLHKDAVIVPKKGIDKEKAIRHLQAVSKSYFISKKDKIISMAFLMSRWFEDIKL